VIFHAHACARMGLDETACPFDEVQHPRAFERWHWNFKVMVSGMRQHFGNHRAGRVALGA
jgi:hypothetical protein